MDTNYNNKGTKDPMLSQKDLKNEANPSSTPTDRQRSSVVTSTEESHADAGVAESGSGGPEQQQPSPTARRSRRVTYSLTNKLDLPHFSIITDEAQTGLTEYGFENPRFSTKTGRASLMEQSVPTKSTVDFYARQSQVSQAAHRRSQLADELGRMPITQKLVSGRFSRAVVSEVLDNGARSGPRHSNRSQESSLRYPDVGKLDLQDSDSEIDDLPDN